MDVVEEVGFPEGIVGIFESMEEPLPRGIKTPGWVPVSPPPPF